VLPEALRARAAAGLRRSPAGLLPSPRRLRAALSGYGGADGAPTWVSGLLAGLQAAVLSFLVVSAPALAAYVATSADPSNAEVGWPRAVVVAGALWLLGHGGMLPAAGVTVTFVPLGLSLLALFSAYASARRSAYPTASAWWAGVVGYLGLVVVVLLAVGQAGPMGAGGPAVLRTLVGAAALAAVGTGLGTAQLGRRVRRAVRRLPAYAAAGVGGGVVVGALVLLAGAAVTCWWAFSGRAATGDVIAGLRMDLLAGGLLAVAQLAVVPNLVAWAAAWVVGPGFSVGAGTLYSPAEVTSAALPALPVLGSLPTDRAAGGVLTVVPVLVVLAGAAGGWYVHRAAATTSTGTGTGAGTGTSPTTPRAWHAPAAAGVVGLTTAVLLGGLTLAAGGAVGPGRMSVVGGSALLVGAVAGGLSLAGALLVAVPADVHVRAAVAGAVRSGVARLRGRSVGTDDEVSPAPSEAAAGR
jgi:hypothetical protein